MKTRLVGLCSTVALLGALASLFALSLFAAFGIASLVAGMIEPFDTVTRGMLPRWFISFVGCGAGAGFLMIYLVLISPVLKRIAERLAKLLVGQDGKER